MTVLTLQSVPVGGLAEVVFSAADVAGDDAETGLGIALLIRNNDSVVRTVTVDTPGTVRGLLVENPAVAVPVGGIAVVSMVRQVFGNPASVTYDVATSIEVALVKLAR